MICLQCTSGIYFSIPFSVIFYLWPLNVGVHEDSILSHLLFCLYSLYLKKSSFMTLAAMASHKQMFHKFTFPAQITPLTLNPYTHSFMDIASWMSQRIKKHMY